MEQVLDSGAFGQVVKCIDMREGGNPVAVKISRNINQEMLNAQVEVRILKQILGKNGDKHGIVQMIDNFSFRSFYIIVFELLQTNLYRHMKAPDFKGMLREDLRGIAS